MGTCLPLSRARFSCARSCPAPIPLQLDGNGVLEAPVRGGLPWALALGRLPDLLLEVRFRGALQLRLENLQRVRGVLNALIRTVASDVFSMLYARQQFCAWGHATKSLENR